MILLGLVTLAVYTLALILIDLTPGMDVVQPLAVGWTGAWLLGSVFGARNLWDATLDVKSAYRRERSATVKAGGLWLMRSDFLQCSACLLMVSAGGLAILQWSSPEVRTGLILAGGLSVVINQVWNRLDRERVIRMPSIDSERRSLERLAREIAVDARVMGHLVANELSEPVGLIDLVLETAVLTPQHRVDLVTARDRMLDLSEHISALHQEIRNLEPKPSQALPEPRRLPTEQQS
jgi:hypothetical protein